LPPPEETIAKPTVLADLAHPTPIVGLSMEEKLPTKALAIPLRVFANRFSNVPIMLAAVVVEETIVKLISLARLASPMLTAEP